MAIAAVGVAFAAGQAAAQTATMAVGAPVTSIDPHYHQLSPNNARRRTPSSTGW